MKRYRVLFFDFDARSHALTIDIRNEWEDRIKEMHRANRRKVQEGLIYEFGILDFHRKERDFIDLGPKPWSILAFHNEFLSQVRVAFVMGSYYPALTGACALGERILNHLALKFRDSFRDSEYYKRVYLKESFANWELAISALESWSILLPETARLFREFAQIRNRSLHFRPEVDANTRELALEAVNHLNDIIGKQFGALGPLPWFIPDFPGEIYIKKEMETDPFVKEVYLPNCKLVGYEHELEIKGNRFVVYDDHDYDVTEVTDEEFKRLRKSRIAPQGIAE